MTALLPWWWRWAALGLIVAFSFGYGYWKGDEHGSEKLAVYIGKQAVEGAKIVTRQGQVTERVVTKYKDRAAKTEVVTQTIDKEVTKYVEGKPLTLACKLDSQWIGLHDRAALGAVPDR